MAIGAVADDIAARIERAGAEARAALFEPVLRLGVTGLARAGKTVFITSLVANLLDRGRMPQLQAAGSGAIHAAWLQPQPDDAVPRFAYERHLSALTGTDPHWPESTAAASQLRLSLRVQPGGMLGAVTGLRTVHLDIVDYPGEWLLDLALIGQDHAGWSAAALARADSRGAVGAEALAPIRAADPTAAYDEATAQALAVAWTDYLRAARDAGLADCTPGRFLLPGEMAGSPALTFAPLPGSGPWPRGSLGREFARRFEAYKREVVRPFFRDHFARIDRQVVLADVLGAIHDGPRAVAELGDALTAILGTFRPGRSSWLAPLIGRRVDRILFAATKADHLHHDQHDRLTAITHALLRQASDRAEFAGARTAAMSIAALRATVEETKHHAGREIGCVRGRLADGRQAALYPGALPEDPMAIIDPARAGEERWLDAEYSVMRFQPAALTRRPGEGPPHIRLDRAAEFLLGDRLR